MRQPQSNGDWIYTGIGGFFALVILYYYWSYIVGILALCGIYCLIQEFGSKPPKGGNRCK